MAGCVYTHAALFLSTLGGLPCWSMCCCHVTLCFSRSLWRVLRRTRPPTQQTRVRAAARCTAVDNNGASVPLRSDFSIVCSPTGPSPLNPSCPGAHQARMGRPTVPSLLYLSNRSRSTIWRVDKCRPDLAAAAGPQQAEHLWFYFRESSSHAWGAPVFMRSSLVKKTSSYLIACSVVLLLITAWSTRTGSPDTLGRKVLKASGQPPKSRALCVVGVQVTALITLLPPLACRVCEFAGMLSSAPHAQTGFTRPGASLQYNYQQRRTALRQSWFPADQDSLDQLQRDTSFVLRFVIGHSKLYSAEQELSAEARRHGGFLRLPMQACTRYLTPIML